LSQNTKDSRLSHGENPIHLVLKWYQFMAPEQTDRRTDRITTANMRYSYASSRTQKLKLEIKARQNSNVLASF